MFIEGLESSNNKTKKRQFKRKTNISGKLFRKIGNRSKDVERNAIKGKVIGREAERKIIREVEDSSTESNGMIQPFNVVFKKRSSCYLCHEEGHKINKCPLGHKKDGFRVCYRCGSTEHTIKVCKKRNTESLPFETCIFCKKVGHISSYCPQHMNSRMRFKCGANGHIARDCEGQKSGNDAQYSKKRNAPYVAKRTIDGESADVDDDDDDSSLKPQIIQRSKIVFF